MINKDISHIRNISIIAHVDHGKSTLADRLLEITNTISKREMTSQVLDKMDLERSRGITIKAHPVTISYKSEDGDIYQINLIDTPGHVDFSYEVSRSLAACEGVLLIVDAICGVQSQTVANTFLAKENNLVIIPIINKIDLPGASVNNVKPQIEKLLGTTSSILETSAKKGIGIKNILEEIVYKIPHPPKSISSDLQAFVFDSHYDKYRGVMLYIKIIDGEIKKGLSIKLLSNNKQFEILEVGKFVPCPTPTNCLFAGEVGYILANIKNTKDVNIGDTIVETNSPIDTPLPGFKKISPVVFAGLFAVDNSEYNLLKDAIDKLQLNDSSLHVEKEKSALMGNGFRCGFLGLLHLEIVLERLSQEFDVEVITTAPTVSYNCKLKDGSTVIVDNPLHLPDPSKIDYLEEPWVICNIITPSNHLGSIMNLIHNKRGEIVSNQVVDSYLSISANMPLNEIITDFNDTIKSTTNGYGSFNYKINNYKKSDIVKMNVLVNGEIAESLSMLMHKSKTESKGKIICKKLLELLPKQQFKVPIQCAISGKIIARETISATSKNVTAKCYGGDITRKRKLWERQKKGKKQMQEIGKVKIPKKVFVTIIKSI